MRDKIGPVAAFKTVLTVNRLPKTRSGKILRGTMRKIADGEEYKMPATIDDPAILAEITAALKAKGFPSRPPALKVNIRRRPCALQPSRPLFFS